MGTGIGFSKFFFHTKLVLVTGTIGYLYFFFLKKIFHTNLVLILSSRSVFIRLGYGHKISHIQVLVTNFFFSFLFFPTPTTPIKFKLGGLLELGEVCQETTTNSKPLGPIKLYLANKKQDSV